MNYYIIKKFQDFLLENEITNLKIIENEKQIKITFKTLEKDKEFHNNKNHLEFTFSFNNLPNDLIKNIHNDFQEIKKLNNKLLAKNTKLETNEISSVSDNNFSKSP